MALPNLPSTSSFPALSTDSPPTAPHVAYVLLAEFDIDEGSLLRHSYPGATGTDEHLLAEHMLPDGAHDREGDSTIFYLNQIPALTVDTTLGGSSSATDAEGRKGKGCTMENGRRKDENEGGLLYVISVVRTQKLSTVRRGALVKAMAVVTRHPFIQIYKNLLVLALDDYFKEPNIGVLLRFYDALNAMDMTGAPQLSLDERLILRATERLDMFDERFPDREPSNLPFPRTASTPSLSQSQPNNDSTEVLDSDHRSTSSSSISSHASKEPTSRSMDELGTQRTKSRANTISSDYEANGLASSAARAIASASPSCRPKDTHWFETEIVYTRVDVPPKPVPFTVRVPLGTFPGEVGDYSLIKLFQTFSTSTSLSATGPLHPHLHTSGQLTHPIILLFNALVTHKRVVFLGHGQAAAEVASFVLAACALGSGCGSILKGFTDRAFPYTNLTNLDNLQEVPGYIAGVCNPAFADRPGWWDVLCNIETGKIVVSKDITPAPPPARTASLLAQASIRSQASAQSVRMQGADVLASLAAEDGEFGKLLLAGGGVGAKVDTKADLADNLFMDEITNLVGSHMGESIIRYRFTEFAHRFVAVASRYEEEIDGNTTIGWPSLAFTPASNGVAARLGSGVVFADEAIRTRDMVANAGRIEGWRLTPSYMLYQQAFADRQAEAPIRGFDLLHQLARFRYCRNLPGAEVSLILQTLASHLRTEEQVTALLACLPTFAGGLLPITFGLFHRDEEVRDVTVDILTALNSHPTGSRFILTLNAFQRSAFVRLAQERRDLEEPAQNTPPP